MGRTPKKNLAPKEEALSEEIKTPVVKEDNVPIDEQTVEQRLISLYRLQLIDSKIDNIRVIRGGLPLEVQDLEDNCEGLQTRKVNFIQEIADLEQSIVDKTNAIKDAKTLIKRYEDQQNNVRNNREYEALTKEIEYKQLEIQLFEKKIKEITYELTNIKPELEKTEELFEEAKKDLELKRTELDEIIAETEKEEKEYEKKSSEQQQFIEPRLLTAYSRIRKSSRNGLAVVKVERDACGGCFNKIPPQRHLDIKIHKKIIVCEYCGRVLIDEELAAKA